MLQSRAGLREEATQLRQPPVINSFTVRCLIQERNTNAVRQAPHGVLSQKPLSGRTHLHTGKKLQAEIPNGMEQEAPERL